MVELEGGELPLVVQAELLGISRSSLYYKPVQPAAEEVAIKHRIDELYTEYPFYGSRRMAASLRREGVVVNRKAVQRHMQQMGIEAIYPGPNTSKRRLEHQVYPYLLRGLTISGPDHVWGVDITYVRMRAAWMIMDDHPSCRGARLALEHGGSSSIMWLGSWIKRSGWGSYSRRWKGRCRERGPQSAIAIRVATSRVPSSWVYSRLPMLGSAWTDEAGLWITCSPRGSGAL